MRLAQRMVDIAARTLPAREWKMAGMIACVHSSSSLGTILAGERNRLGYLLIALVGVLRCLCDGCDDET